MDREKVIKGIERCLVCETSVIATEEGQKAYRECEYTTGLYCRRDNLLRDALELLKEQEAEWIEYPECLAYDGANSDSHIVCSACKHVFSIMDNCTEEFDYCPHCGAKMTQEGR